MIGTCEGIRVELSGVEFLDLLHANHCESICQSPCVDQNSVDL